jgi:hypothetical protein
MRRGLLAGVIILAIARAAIEAHHAISAVYDATRSVTLEGVVVQVQFVNPHPFILVDVKERDGRPQSWRLEMDNRWELAQIGFAADTLRHGDRVVVRGSLARNQSQSIYLLRLDRPVDGFWYEQVGMTPHIGKGNVK